MKLPMSRTRAQRMAWIALTASLVVGAASLCGSYNANAWSSFDNIWWCAFNPDAPPYWYQRIGAIADFLFFASIATMIAGDAAMRAANTTIRWVRKGT